MLTNPPYRLARRFAARVIEQHRFPLLPRVSCCPATLPKSSRRRLLRRPERRPTPEERRIRAGGRRAGRRGGVCGAAPGRVRNRTGGAVWTIGNVVEPVCWAAVVPALCRGGQGACGATQLLWSLIRRLALSFPTPHTKVIGRPHELNKLQKGSPWSAPAAEHMWGSPSAGHHVPHVEPRQAGTPLDPAHRSGRVDDAFP